MNLVIDVCSRNYVIEKNTKSTTTNKFHGGKVCGNSISVLGLNMLGNCPSWLSFG